MSIDPQINIEKKIMSVINEEQVKMKPRWYFVLGSVLMTGGLTGLAILSTFLVSVISFSVRTHGGVGRVMHYERFFATFPFGAVILAIVGIGVGVWLLKKYDFSYKRNFQLLIISAISAIFFAGLLINYTGIDRMWMKRGPMRNFYQQYDGGIMMRGSGWHMIQNNAR